MSLLKPRKPRPQTKSTKPISPLLEKHITQQVCDFLGYRGWRGVRMNVVTSQNAAGGWVKSGEKGMCDWLFLNYTNNTDDGKGRILWVEMKAPGKDLSGFQIDWQFKEIHRGALVVTADNIEEFQAWYEETFPHGIR